VIIKDYITLLLKRVATQVV